MAPTLYSIPASPAVRAVLMTVKALGLKIVEKEVKFLEGEHLKPEYLELNPQHTVPTLVDDDGFTIWDSHAIMVYLVSKYAKNDNLYPKDIKKRAVVDQRLHFESGIVFASLRSITKPVLQGEKTSIDDKDRENVKEGYAFLESFLEGKQWVAGHTVTIADFSLISSISSLNKFVPIDPQTYPNITAWLKKAETLPAYEANKKGLNAFKELFGSKLSLP